LALNLHKTVEELKQTMSYREFQSWQVYYNEEPFLADRLEIQLSRIGQITSLTGMQKIDLPDNYFVISDCFKAKDTKLDLAAQVMAVFGVE
jgi:hypothetical protein